MEYARRINPDVIFAIGHSEVTPHQIEQLGERLKPTLMTHTLNVTDRGIPDSGFHVHKVFLQGQEIAL